MSIQDSPQQTPVVVQQQNFDSPENRELIESIPVIVSETRKGWKTTEFWVTVMLSLLTILDGIPLPEKFEGVVLGLLGVAYIVSRGVAKKGVPEVEPKSLPDA
jgi:hypothetical protein